MASEGDSIMSTLSHTFPTPLTAFRSSWRTLVFANDGSYSQALLRIVAALVLLPHGMQHFLGFFGGHGFAGTLQWMTGTLGFPAALAAPAILLEFFGPVLLLAGVATRPVAAALACFMAVAASTHLSNGFFMNWFGTLPAGVEGFEYHLLAVAILVAIAARGGGAFAVDRWLARS
jgi:putative oxidoreductase